MKGLTAKIILILLVMVAWLASGPAHATPPGQNGRIAYRVYFNQRATWGAIFTMESDGSDVAQVTHPRRGIRTTEPDVSTDGQWITFTRVPRGGDLLGPPIGKPNHIFIIRPDSMGRTDLSQSCHAEEGCLGDQISAWSPDDSRFVFIRSLDASPTRGYVFRMRADGTHVRKLTDPGGHFSDLNPSWSPDGTRIVFNRYSVRRDADAVLIMRADGTHERRITRWGMSCANNPDWSPDGQWILFNCTRSVRDNLWLVHPNGTGLHRLTRNPNGKFDWASSSFSPDGTMIVTARLPGVGAAGNADVYVMNADGTGLQNVTNSDLWDSAPDWGPLPT
jgi:TolB protein